MTCPAISRPTRNAISKASSPGIAAARTARGKLAPSGASEASRRARRDPHQGAGRVAAAGGKLADQEKFKRELASLRCLSGVCKEQARRERGAEARRQFPLALLRPVLCRAGAELLYVPAADPNGILKHWQFARPRRTRGQICRPLLRMSPRAPICRCARSSRSNAVAVVEAIQDLGLCSRGSGADNIRNVTGTPTAGIDPQELIDTRPYAREWHLHILNERALYGLPRKFNVGFDGAGRIPVLEDTNDIGFQAVEVEGRLRRRARRLVPPRARRHHRPQGFRARHRRHRQAEEATQVADAIVRVFIEHGNRTDRNKARLKYVLDAWGLEKFMAPVEEKLGRKLTRVPPEAIAPRPAFDRFAHIGVHAQKQAGLELDRRGAAGRHG